MTGRGFLIPTAPQFNFHRTVHSHGWLTLAPFSWDGDRETLQYIYQTAAGDIQRLQMSGAENGVRVHLPDCREISPALQAEVRAAVRRMLNIDWDLRPFYAAMRAHAGYEWLEREGQGRLLICPSLWEDLAKVLLTTNCNWAQTVNMSQRLCRLGAAHPALEGCHAFPSPQRIAALDVGDLAESVRAGYRTACLHQLAQDIASGGLAIDCWRSLDSEGLYGAVKALKGFGDYAAGTVARMLGHFDRIAIDSACHAMFAARHNHGAKAAAKTIAAHYETFGENRGLVLWLDIMRHHSRAT